MSAAPPAGAGARPRLLILTDRGLAESAGHALPDLIAAAISGGGRAFVLREKDLDRSARLTLAWACLERTAGAGATLAIASDGELAARLGGLPLHLAASDPAPAQNARWGRSCHDAGEVRRALAEGAAYATVSPVFASASKPGYGPPLGEEGLRELVAAADALPVYALGGVTPQTCTACLRAGADGVAVMAHVMSARDPAAAVAALLRSLGAAGAPLPGRVEHT